MTVDGKFMRGNIVCRAPTVCDPLIGVSIRESKSRATSLRLKPQRKEEESAGGRGGKSEKDATG